MAVALLVSKYFGLAIVDVVLYAFLLLWKTGQVIKARKRFGVKYPTVYEDKPDSDFNRYQRAHANSLELAPIFLPTLLLSALDTPIVSAVAGLVYIFGRYMYGTGYYESVSARTRGGKYYAPAQIYLVVGTLRLAIKLLQMPESNA